MPASVTGAQDFDSSGKLELFGCTTIHGLLDNTSLKGKDTLIEDSPELDAASDYPDGGTRAWLVVFGAMCSTFSTTGYANAWGVFQAYYEQNTLRDLTPSKIAWIGSVQFAMNLLPGIVTGRLFDLGYFKLPFFIASIVLVMATLLVAQCTEYWQFLLCQGFATGLACGTIFGPIIGIIGHWFHKKRGLAIGLVALGPCLGGTVFSITARRLIKVVGLPWTMRIIALIFLVSVGLPNFILKRRLPPKDVSGGLFNLGAFKSGAYTIYCISALIAFLGFYTIMVYIDIHATSVGISPDFSFYLVSIANAASLAGRTSTAMVVDRFGAINVIAPMSFAAAMLTFAWPFARTKPSLIAIAVLYGFSTAAYVSAGVLPLFALGEIGDVGRRTGMAMTFLALGALAGPPISGAINHATGGFEAVGYYAGTAILLSILLMLITRHLVLRRFWGKF